MSKEIRKHIDKFKSFSNKMTNKFDFVLGKEYSLDELPQHIRDDIERQFDEYRFITNLKMEWVKTLHHL